MAKLTPNVDTKNASVNAQGSGWRKYAPFAADVPRQAIGTALVDESATGNQSQFDRVGYNSLAEQAAAAGRGVGTQQQSLADALLARSQGRGGPSLAEMQLKQSLEGQRKSAADALAGVRGMNPAAAQRLLLSQQANLGQQAAGQGAMLRAQEQLAAQTALGNQLGAMRGAEQASFAGAGQLGLGQEKLSVEAQEAQRSREMEIALANQRAEQVRQQLQQSQENQAYETAAASRANAGNAVNQLVSAFAAHGGIIRKYAEGGKINAAMGKLTKMDNEKNDVVPAMLSPGEIVIPRSIVSAPNAPVAAAKFVQALLANKGKKDAKMVALKAALANK